MSGLQAVMGKPVHVRIDDDFRSDFDAALDLTGMGETQFVKAAIKAFIEYVRENEEITVPLAILPKSAVKKAVSKSEATDTPTRSPHGVNEDSPTISKPVSRAHAALKKMTERERKAKK